MAIRRNRKVYRSGTTSSTIGHEGREIYVYECCKLMHVVERYGITRDIKGTARYTSIASPPSSPRDGTATFSYSQKNNHGQKQSDPSLVKTRNLLSQRQKFSTHAFILSSHYGYVHRSIVILVCRFSGSKYGVQAHIQPPRYSVR